MSLGGLSPQEIEARRRALMSSDLATKYMSWYSFPPNTPVLTNPAETFVPEEDYFLTGLSVDAYAAGYGTGGTLVLAWSPDPSFLYQPASSGVILLKMGLLAITHGFWNFTPHGFYIERGHALYLHIITPPLVPATWGSINLFLLPMGG